MSHLLEQKDQKYLLSGASGILDFLPPLLDERQRVGDDGFIWRVEKHNHRVNQ